MNLLITGKNSYIGQSVEAWIQSHHPDWRIDTIDTRDGKWLEHDFAPYDVVFHVAGIAHANAKEDQRDLYYAVNTDLTIDIANHAKATGVKQFIFMSSAIVYTSSELEKGRITYDTVPKSDDPYGDSKIQAEAGILPLQDDTFNVVVLRPPMVYGKGSKGNYPRLAKLAQQTPFFPHYENRRSMIHIENLAEFIRLMIVNEEAGIFWPQNKEYVNTSDMVATIARFHGHRLHRNRLFNPFIQLVEQQTLVNKLFGNLYYEMEMSDYDKGDYRVNDFETSIAKTEAE